MTFRSQDAKLGESEIQEMETQGEDGTEVVESEDDIWALSADFTCRHQRTDENKMLLTKKPSRCH